MKKFNILKGIPANLPMINVDTDMIIPKQFLKTIKRTDLGKSLFFEMRYDENEKKIENFIQYSKRKESIEINLTEQEIIFGNKRIKFEIDPFKKKCLLNGSDDIAMSLEQLKKISFYENQVKKNKSWIN